MSLDTVVKELSKFFLPISSIMVGFGSFLRLYWLVLVFPRGGTGATLLKYTLFATVVDCLTASISV